MFLQIIFFVMLCATSITIHNFDTHMLKDMAIMMGAQMGASFANQEVEKEYQEATEAIKTDQKTLNNSSNTFFSNIGNIKSSQLTNISNIFSAASNEVNTLQTNQQNELTNTENYIQAVSSSNLPLAYYLDKENTVLFDQLFENSKMYTPQGVTWRNIFQIGDWMFDENTNSFWQLKAKPFLTTDITTQKPSYKDAHKNSIFTEWNSSTNYEISCDITLYKVSYPFYAGIIFNKARWISGDTYGIEKYRTLGIYGDANKNITLCFAQQKTDDSAKGTTPTPPNTPLDQIYQNQAKQNFTINQNTFKNISTAPITFHIKIKPTPGSVSYKIWGKGSTEPTSYTTVKTSIINKSTTISVGSGNSKTTYASENDNDIFLYHGVGFLSPGAVCQFTLKGPQPLLFNSSNLKLFQKEVENYYLDQKNKLLTKSL